jgi:hypothetical protein
MAGPRCTGDGAGSDARVCLIFVTTRLLDEALK